MEYPVRRKDRESSREEALAALDRAPYGVLSAAGPGGIPYGVPLSLAREGEWLYFHCAREGRKLDCLRARREVSLVFVGTVEALDDHFSVVYDSAVVRGSAEEVTREEERVHGLRLICRRFTPGHMDAFDGEIARSLRVVSVWKIHIDGITGKRRKPPGGQETIPKAD
ncbi:MAG: pyridoxamine 5'-phosphate oxidase family protein [Treponema sp.]|jgi:nitroimidazol reductase NimA-like FMN-containing flavoprotein (pyridoxamine 5'-phosphate oxidase superfamily)|nr:pyridoxamine 5'-phosphate oxidase family protein [Treponema sp.]